MTAYTFVASCACPSDMPASVACQSASKRDPLSARKRDPLSGWRNIDVTLFLALRAA